MADYTWIRGLLTLGTAPSVEEFKNLGLNLALAFKYTAATHLGEAGIPIIVNGEAGAKTKEEEGRYSIVAYFMSDEPVERGVSANRILERIDRCRSQSSLPITCIFSDYGIYAHKDWGHARVFPELDFICIDSYFYQRGALDERRLGWAKGAVSYAQGFGKPVIGIGQAFEGEGGRFTRPDIPYVDGFWRSRGCGIIWYAWNTHDAAVGDRPQDAWYREQIAKINGMPWPPAPPPPTYTKKTVTCLGCEAILELTISSDPSENMSQVCPVCGTPAD